jgi:hypothetical protein
MSQTHLKHEANQQITTQIFFYKYIQNTSLIFICITSISNLMYGSFLKILHFFFVNQMLELRCDIAENN